MKIKYVGLMGNITNLDMAFIFMLLFNLVFWSIGFMTDILGIDSVGGGYFLWGVEYLILIFFFSLEFQTNRVNGAENNG